MAQEIWDEFIKNEDKLNNLSKEELIGVVKTLLDYANSINQLRYERLIEKARRYRAESNNELCVKFYWDITEYKPTNEIIEQLSRIAEAYEARTKRIKKVK